MNVVSARKAGIIDETLTSGNNQSLNSVIKIAPDLYALTKRIAYLIVFKQFIMAKFKRVPLSRPKLDAQFLDDALVDVIKYVQRSCFGVAVEFLKSKSPDAFDSFLKHLSDKANTSEEMRQVSELRTLRNLRPCVDSDSVLRIEGRLENADLPLDIKHPIILPSRHALTSLIVLHEHCNSGHAGPAYTLMKTRRRYWIIYGISSVKRTLRDCSKCRLRKATPIRQLMADLPECRVTATEKPFMYCVVDYLGPFTYRQLRSDCKAWGILFTCLCTRCIHVEIVTSLDLNS